MIPAPTTLPTRLSTAAATQGLFRAYHPARRAAVVAPARIAAFSPSTVRAPCFHAMMRSKDADRLDPWIASGSEGKLASFAAGVEADKQAIAAAITEPWSSGQVEGKINRLKLIERQMFGRANLDLLKARLMAAA